MITASKKMTVAAVAASALLISMLALSSAQQSIPVLATATFSGTIDGTDPEEQPGIARAGTARYVSVQHTSNYASAEDLVDALVADLQSHGINVSETDPLQFVITMGIGDKNEFTFGCTDNSLLMEGGISQDIP